MSKFDILCKLNVKNDDMKTQQYLDHLISEGKISFTKEQMQRALKLSVNATNCCLRRLKQKGQIASPVKKYYLIIPPEFRSLGCLPPDFFIDDLMQYLHLDYRIALLSAALYHGAAHQQPQVFQVMLPITHRNIQCGRVRIRFIRNKHLRNNPVVKLKTRTGLMRVATPEATAKDLLSFMRQSGGISQIATVLDELAEVLNPKKLEKLARQSKQLQWAQRLGYMLEALGHDALSTSLWKIIKNKKQRYILLVPANRKKKGMLRDKKWHIVKNATIESDLENDTY